MATVMRSTERSTTKADKYWDAWERWLWYPAVIIVFGLIYWAVMQLLLQVVLVLESIH